DGPQEPPGYNMVHIGREKVFHNNFVVQVDGSWDRKSGKAGWGMTVSTNGITGDEVATGQHGRAVSSDHAEAKACLLALTWASNRQISQIRINTDSTALVSYLRMGKVSDISIIGTIGDIKALGSTFRQCTILKVPRDEVHNAHMVANRCRIFGFSVF
ncbi:hypothetical protein SOVF_114640, partial [Spinacia oleracea]